MTDRQAAGLSSFKTNRTKVPVIALHRCGSMYRLVKWLQVSITINQPGNFINCPESRAEPCGSMGFCEGVPYPKGIN
ncbi:MAG: hypothetical protein ACPG5T_10645, partial [Endozoicomonas sp.]